MMNNRCETGCMTYTGGEKRHDKNCQHYPESLTKMYDDLLIEVKKLRLHNVSKLILEAHDDGHEKGWKGGYDDGYKDAKKKYDY